MSRTLKLAGFCLLGLLILLFTTNPQTLPSVILVLPFVLVFLILSLSFLYVGRNRGIGRGRVVRFSIFGAALPTIMLVLQSLGQLTVRDILTIFVLFCMAYFYMARVTGKAQT